MNENFSPAVVISLPQKVLQKIFVKTSILNEKFTAWSTVPITSTNVEAKNFQFFHLIAKKMLHD